MRIDNPVGQSSALTGSFSGSFVGNGANLTGVTAASLDIDNFSALGSAGVAQGDNFLFSDAGTEKKVTFSNLEDTIFGNISGDATVAAGGALTIAADSVEGTMLNTNAADTTTLELSSDTLSVLKVPNDLTVDNATIALNSGTTFNGSGAVTISVKDGGIDADALASSVAGAGLAGGGGTVLSVGAGSGITANANDVAVTAAQTAITSLINASLTKIGTATDQEYVDFSTSNEVNVKVNDTERLSVTAAGVDITGAATVSTDLTVSGNLTVAGTQTQLNTATLNIEDKNLLIASGAADSATADGAGITVDGASATFTYSHSGTQWNMNKALDMGANTITTTGAIAGATLNTGQGANELYAMDQDVQTSDSPQFTGVNVGHASDTTLTRASAGDINVEGNLVYRAGGTDVPVADGGTGASTLTDGGVLLGSGTSAITAMAVLSDGEMIVGDGSGDPVAESGATLRTSIGVGTANDVQFDSFGVGTAASGTTGEIRATNDVTAFYSSDERLKENIVQLDRALDKVNSLRGVTFDWKDLTDEEQKTIHSHEGSDIGVIAQEVQEQYPELVQQREHGYLAVDYQKLTAVLIEAVKELAAKVDELSK